MAQESDRDPRRSGSLPSHVLIATPSLRAPTVGYAESLFSLQKLLGKAGTEVDLKIAAGISVIAHARNYLASLALARPEISHLLFIDDDLSFEAGEVLEMLRWSESDVVAAIYSRREFDWERIKKIVLANPAIDSADLPGLGGVYRGMFWLDGDQRRLVPGMQPMLMERIGTGLMLISRACLLKLVEAGLAPQIPFNATADANLPIHDFFGAVGATEGLGEDVHFCHQVRKAGGRILGCSWLRVEHVGQFAYVGDLRAIARQGDHGI
ncbi:hypothetical protein [Labrys neptuniae]